MTCQVPDTYPDILVSDRGAASLAVDVGGADCGPICFTLNVFGLSSGFTTSFSEMLIGDGVRRSPFRPRCCWPW